MGGAANAAPPPPRDHAAGIDGGLRRPRPTAPSGRTDPGWPCRARRVARKVERDDALGAKRARHADRHRIDDRAVEQPASVDLDRVKYARQRVGSADRLDQGPAPEPDLVPVADLGRDAGEPDRQILDLKPAERRLEPRPQPLAADKAAAGEREIEQPEHPPPGQRTGEGLQHVQPPGRVAAADERADRRADHDIGPQPQRVKFLHCADVGPAARRARAEHDAHFRPPGTVRRPTQGTQRQCRFCGRPP